MADFQFLIGSIPGRYSAGPAPGQPINLPPWLTPGEHWKKSKDSFLLSTPILQPTEAEQLMEATIAPDRK